MKWRDIFIGAIASLVVTILGGVIIFYVTKEPPAPEPDEYLIFNIDETATYKTDLTNFRC